MSQEKLFKMLEKEQKCMSTRDLYEWSLNCEQMKPWMIFQDLIGYSETYGSVLADYKEPSLGLGYLELYKLGRALEEYAHRPKDVENFIERIFDLEIGEAVNE